MSMAVFSLVMTRAVRVDGGSASVYGAAGARTTVCGQQEAIQHTPFEPDAIPLMKKGTIISRFVEKGLLFVS